MSNQQSNTEEKAETRVEPSVPRADRQDLPQSNHGATPGPWEQDGTPDREGAISVHRDGFAVARVFLRASSPASGPAYYQREANARLIAAAPELLAMLKAIVEPAKHLTVENLLLAREVIAKAEGR